MKRWAATCCALAVVVALQGPGGPGIGRAAGAPCCLRSGGHYARRGHFKCGRRGAGWRGATAWPVASPDLPGGGWRSGDAGVAREAP
eukprot:582483-Alexandrium_andersonii.AAC.1